MMPGRAGGVEYDARIGRAEHLRSRHPAAAEFLTFYEQVASFQKLLRAKISAEEVKPDNALPAELRAELDLMVLLPHFRGYLSVVENHAPRALAESALQIELEH